MNGKSKIAMLLAQVLCAALTASAQAAPADNREVASHLVATFVQAENTMNAQLLDQIIAPNYIQHNPHVAPGLIGVKRFFESQFQDLKARHMRVRVIAEDVVVDGDRVVLRQLTKFQRNGKWYQVRELDEWRVANGKFVEHWDDDDAPQPSQP